MIRCDNTFGYLGLHYHVGFFTIPPSNCNLYPTSMWKSTPKQIIAVFCFFKLLKTILRSYFDLGSAKIVFFFVFCAEFAASSPWDPKCCAPGYPHDSWLWRCCRCQCCYHRRRRLLRCRHPPPAGCYAPVPAPAPAVPVADEPAPHAPGSDCPGWRGHVRGAVNCLRRSCATAAVVAAADAAGAAAVVAGAARRAWHCCWRKSTRVWAWRRTMSWSWWPSTL